MTQPECPPGPSITASAGQPRVERPYVPGYGIPESVEGALPWSWVEERLGVAETYWVATTSPDGRPHLMPVWGAWLDGRVWIEGGRATRRARNLAADPRVTVGVELAGDGAVIVEGIARAVDVPADLALRLVEAFGKYAASRDYHTDPTNWTGEGAIWAVEPVVVFGWSSFPADATRWRFGDG
jgi:hypothetical protein